MNEGDGFFAVGCGGVAKDASLVSGCRIVKALGNPEFYRRGYFFGFGVFKALLPFC